MDDGAVLALLERLIRSGAVVVRHPPRAVPLLRVPLLSPVAAAAAACAELALLGGGEGGGGLVAGSLVHHPGDRGRRRGEEKAGPGRGRAEDRAGRDRLARWRAYRGRRTTGGRSSGGGGAVERAKKAGRSAGVVLDETELRSALLDFSQGPFPSHMA